MDYIMDTGGSIDSGSSWFYPIAYLSLAATLDCCIFAHLRPYRYRALDVLAQYYAFTYLFSQLSEWKLEPWFSADLYFGYFILFLRFVKSLTIKEEMKCMLGWQVMLGPVKLLLYFLGIGASPTFSSPISTYESPLEVLTFPGFSWTWLFLTLTLSLLLDCSVLCNCHIYLPVTRNVLLYYILNYSLYLCSDYVTGWWYTAEYYFIYILLFAGMEKGMSAAEYVGGVVWWQMVLGGVRVVLYVFGFSESTGWVGSYILPVLLIPIKYCVCAFACFYLSMVIMSLLDRFRDLASKPKTASEMTAFATKFFSLFFLTIGMLVAAWVVMWVVQFVFGSVPWLMLLWYKVTIAALAVVSGDIVIKDDMEGKAIALTSYFLATFISIYIIEEVAGVVLG